MSHFPDQSDQSHRGHPYRSSPASWSQEIPEVEPVESVIPVPPQVWPVRDTAPPVVGSATPYWSEAREAVQNRCGHCGLPVEEYVVFCPWCGTDLRIAGTIAATMPPVPQWTWSLRALIAVLVGYGLILGIVILCAVILVLQAQQMGLDLGNHDLAAPQMRRLSELALQQMALAAVASSLVVLATWIAAGPLRRLPEPSDQNRVLAWVLGLMVVLPALLALNLGYALLVRRVVGEDVLDLRIVQELVKVPLFWGLLTIQPAIFEELFFRYLTLGALYEALRSVGRQQAIHLSVFLSSLMFAVAHLGQLVAVPYLLIVGLALGYLRLASGGLALPMFVHFLHNAAVLALAHLSN